MEDTLRLLNLDEHPREGPHCVEDTLRFLQSRHEHPHEGPHCVEDTLRFRAESLLGRHERKILMKDRIVWKMH